MLLLSTSDEKYTTARLCGFREEEKTARGLCDDANASRIAAAIFAN
jgi:hypothetical protein